MQKRQLRLPFMREGERFMKDSNPYRVRRRKMIIKYIITFIAFFLLGMLTGAGEDSVLFKIGMMFIVLDSMLIVMLPLFVYRMRVLGREAKKLDNEGRFTNRDDDMNMTLMAILLLLLPPLGVYAIIRQLNTMRRRLLEQSIYVRSMGEVLMGLVALATVSGIFTGAYSSPEGAFMIVVTLYYGISALIVVAAGALAHKYGRLYAICTQAIYADAELKISDIAERLRLTYGKTAQLIMNMIDAGVLGGAYIDFKHREVVAPTAWPKEARKCKGCGGTTICIQKRAGVCRYCGRVLK